MKRTAQENRESVNRSVQFHLAAYTGHGHEGLAEIMKGFNGENLSAKVWSESVSQRRTNRHTEGQTVESYTI